LRSTDRAFLLFKLTRSRLVSSGSVGLGGQKSFPFAGTPSKSQLEEKPALIQFETLRVFLLHSKNTFIPIVPLYKKKKKRGGRRERKEERLCNLHMQIMPCSS